jgi:hypothetical protein
VTIPFKETLAANGKTHTQAAAARVTFLGCSTLDVAGRPEPVLNYRVSMSTLNASGRDRKVGPKQREAIYSISQNYGWRLREEGSDGGVIQATKISTK